MLKWLQRLAQGDRRTVPAELVTKLDDQGRVTEIRMSAGPAPDEMREPAEITVSPKLGAALVEACNWLTARNVALARD